MKTIIRLIIIGCCFFTADLVTESFFDGIIPFRSEAEARVGRPRTPLSVAGVARRTTRRTIRRTAAYVATLPRGCATVVIDGRTLYHCGGTYYQPYNNQYVVVIVH
jgi:hypothetical protein